MSFDSEEDYRHNCPECEDPCDCGDPDECMWCSTCFDYPDPDSEHYEEDE